ncbi:helix-turn-helix domain-containing protein [Streptomyces graminifolii]|uniref:helix-turn-helix domain-containing protein n=1 Tax=Streptomyces graminifolii TaxID=1266771 RepID=UPI0040597D91
MPPQGRRRPPRDARHRPTAQPRPHRLGNDLRTAAEPARTNSKITYGTTFKLSAETVARQHRISVGHLHALFRGSDLTFTAWVRHERLLRIRRDLLASASSDVSTATIAARWGVHDTKHVGRALKREFGETVSDLRRGRRA